MAGKGFWHWYDRGARVDFGATLLALIFDWKPWVFGFGSSAVTFIGTANQGRDPWAVWLAALAAGAFVAVIFIAVRLRKSSELKDDPGAVPGQTPIETVNSLPVTIAKIEFKWTPGGVGSQYVIRALVTPHQNLKCGTVGYVDTRLNWSEVINFNKGIC